MTLSENQATQFYVVTKSAAKVDKTSEAGAFKIGTTKDGKKYLQIKGADTVLRTALIDPKTVMQVKGTKAADMQTALRQATIKFSDEHGAKPIVGQDYTMHVIVRQYQGISDEQNLVKTAAVHVTKSMTTAEAFYKAMAKSLELNFKRELNQLFTFEGTATGIVIKEVEQDWMLGTFEQVPVYFDVFTTTVYSDGDEVNWGKVDYADSTTKIKNGKKIADMEYFYAGEKGDQYRQIGWPNYVPTKYLVDPTKEYNTLNIHFAYVGSNESVQKSEKDIILVSTDAAVLDTIGAEIAKGTTITYDKIASA